jgi:zinc/manganese transport system substrate-binding protein
VSQIDHWCASADKSGPRYDCAVKRCLVSKTRPLAAMLAGITLAVSALVACGTASTPVGASRQLKIVAGENFWGSIATQLLGSHGRVQSVVTDSSTNPHGYRSSGNDARAFAEADIIILNGAGYDDWGRKLLAENPSQDRKVLLVAGVVGASSGTNPHFWYNPAAVGKVADSLTRLYKIQDSADSGDFSRLRTAFDQALQPYLDKVAQIKRTYSGVPVGSTESIFVYMAQALGLNLISPPGFTQAIADGTDPPTSAIAVFQDQVTQKKIKMLAYNLQASTLVTTNLKAMAAAQGIPLVGVTETIPPDARTFQDWQLGQLQKIEAVLAQHPA